jgi:hypothetical protein
VELLLVVRALPLRAIEAAQGLDAPLHVPHEHKHQFDFKPLVLPSQH